MSAAIGCGGTSNDFFDGGTGARSGGTGALAGSGGSAGTAGNPSQARGGAAGSGGVSGSGQGGSAATARGGSATSSEGGHAGANGGDANGGDANGGDANGGDANLGGQGGAQGGGESGAGGERDRSDDAGAAGESGRAGGEAGEGGRVSGSGGDGATSGHGGESGDRAGAGGRTGDAGAATNGGVPGSGGANGDVAGAPGLEIGGEGGRSNACGERERCDGVDNDCNDVADEDGVCPESCRGFELDGRAYMFCTGARGHFASQDVCEKASMSLVRVDSASENAGVLAAVKRLGQEAPLGSIHLGATDFGSSKEGNFRWPDGTVFWIGTATGSAVNGAYENWDDGEPNDYDTNEDCVEMLVDAVAEKAGLWNDVECTSTLSFVCEE